MKLLNKMRLLGLFIAQRSPKTEPQRVASVNVEGSPKRVASVNVDLNR